jgi:hypothetical protein
MKNTIITSISAIVFLVIGLFIGKSNKQIEIQTVVKTNIVEKPVEKVVEAEIPENYKTALEIHNKMRNAKYLGFDKLPSGIIDLTITVLMDQKFEDKINPHQITEALEFEARKIGLKIDNKSKHSLYYELEIMPLENNIQFVYKSKLLLLNKSFLFSEPDKAHIINSEIWKKGSLGFVGKLHFNQTTFNEDAHQKMISFCNRILETREN